MKKHLPLLLALLLFSTIVNAQKDAPVAGHSATLVDLLKKDYNAIDPELRGDELIKDRALVIAIFKTYLTDQQRTLTDQQKIEFRVDSIKILSDAVDTATSKLSAAKRKLASVPTNIGNVSTSKDGAAYVNDLVDLNVKINNIIDIEKQTYFRQKLSLDVKELEVIGRLYKSENKFLKHAIDLYIRKYRGIEEQGTDRFSAASNTSTIQKSIPFIGGDLAFEAVIDGLSRFLAKRIKEELTTYVIERVKVWLNNPREDDPFAEFKVLLPRTTQYLIAFHADKITSFPDEIKQYIEDDLNHLLANASNLEQTPRIAKLVKRHPDIGFAFEALTLIPDLSKLRNPIDFFKTIENSKTLNRWKHEKQDTVKANIANLVQLSSLIGQSMTIVENGDFRFAGKDFFGTYASEENFYLLYMGFLYQQHKKYYDINFNVSVKVNGKETRLNYDMATALRFIANRDLQKNGFFNERKFFAFLLSELGENAEKVMVSATEIRKANKAGVKVGADTIHHFVESMVDLSEKVVEAGDTLVNYLIEVFPMSEVNVYTYPLITKIPFSVQWQRVRLRQHSKPYFSVARTANNIALDLQKKKYANALTKALELGTEIAPSSPISDIKSNLFKLGLMTSSERYKDWHKVVDSILKHKETSKFIVNANLKKTFASVSDEIYRIKLYYKTNFATTPQMISLDDLQKFVDRIAGMTRESDFPTGDYAAIVTLLEGPDFPCLLVSYYVNVSIPTLIVDIGKEMTDIRIMRTDTKAEEKMFTADEISDVKGQVIAYTSAIYKNYILKGYKSESTELIAARKQMTIRLNNYLALLPSRANVATDPRVTSLLHFVNDMAAAEDAEDVEKAIEAFALPAGSYSIKRAALLNVSLNAYPGIFLGGEHAWKTDAGTVSDAFAVSFTAPIGLSVTNGLARGSSIGVFVPVIDIGAVTRLRLDGSTATTPLPEFKFKNFFSPGVFFHYGFRNTPLAINVGGQVGPQIKKIDAEGKATFFDSVRFGAALVLDIPLFNLYNKPRFDD